MLQRLKNLFTRKVRRSAAIRVAYEKGFLDDQQAAEAHAKMVALDPEQTSTDLLIDQGLLSESQAKVVALEMEKEHPGEVIADRFKEARQAMECNKTGATMLGDVLAAKKAGGSG